MPAPTLADVEPTLTFDEAGVNVTPQLIDTTVTFTGPGDDFDGGFLTITGLMEEDRISVRDQGMGLGEIGYDEGTGEVFYGGVLIGFAVGGCGCEPFAVEFNGDATAEAIQALIQNLTYADVSDAPRESRTLLLNVTDASGLDLGLSGLSGFVEQPGFLDPFHDIGVYGGAAPTFGDLDGDGDLDLVVGDFYGDLHYFRNDGTTSAPVWTELTDAANPFDGLPGPPVLTPVLVDLDGDGDLDLVAGSGFGGLGVLENTGDDSNPVFAPGFDDLFDAVYGALTAPAFADLDGDGDVDLILGDAEGGLFYFENTGDATTPEFTERTDAANPFDGIDVGYYSRPVLADVDGDGDLDLVVANRYGEIAYFENEGDESAPDFTERTGAANPFDGVSAGYLTAPALADIDGDGDLDLLVGNSYGAVRYFVNGPSRGVPIVINITPADDAAFAADDDVQATETGVSSGNVFDNNSFGFDDDPDGPDLTVTEVNGAAGDVGSQIVLPSGALLTLNADGSYDYDANGVFDSLPGAASGASNQVGTDTFTYTLAGGSTATVTVFVFGEDSDGDVLRGASGADTLDGGAGVDTVDYSDAGAGVTVKLNGGIAPDDGDGGSDTLINLENVVGTDFDDLLIGNAVANVLTGGTGRDTLIGLDGNDTLIGGSGAANQLQGGLGDDTYVVTAADTVVEFSGQGTDTVQTDRDAYVLGANLENLTYIGAGAFHGVGNGGNNAITGGGGADVLAGGAGVDALVGGGGIDLADYAAAAGGVVADLTLGVASNDGDGASDTLAGIENLTGSAFADTLGGDAAANTLTGGVGDDILGGRGGADLLYGGDGADTADYSGAAAGATVKLNGSVTTDDGDGGADILVSIENATGSAFADLLIGSGVANTLSGGAGADILLGLAGDDILIGGAGAANTLQGGLGDDTYVVSANDTITEFTGEGVDTVRTDRAFYVLAANLENLVFTGAGPFQGTGNALANVITGGVGADTLIGGQGDDALNGGGGVDIMVVGGVRADYTIEDLGGGAFRITDAVGGRDGVDLTTGVERIRFTGDNTAGLLADLATISAPAGPSAKDAAPLVLPAIEDPFVATAKDGGPLVLPGEDVLNADAMHAPTGHGALTLFDLGDGQTLTAPGDDPWIGLHYNWF